MTETARYATFYPDGQDRVTYSPDRDRTPVAYIEDDGRYTVGGFGGVAFYLVGRSQRWAPAVYWCEDESGESGWWEDSEEGEYENDPEGQLWACMVGDDRLHPVDPEDLTPLADDDYCSGCGQVGCTADGR